MRTRINIPNLSFLTVYIRQGECPGLSGIFAFNVFRAMMGTDTVFQRSGQFPFPDQQPADIRVVKSENILLNLDYRPLFLPAALQNQLKMIVKQLIFDYEADIMQQSECVHLIPVIAKLEHPEAIENLHEIIHASDGVMVARGDLGIEMPPEEVPIVQKRIISMANKHLVYVITATQMLDSMVSNPRPTRAEASDVANAVLDGSDAVMLSGETAIGAYPVKTVDMMASIIRQGEQHMEEWGQSLLRVTEDFVQDDAVAITRAARELAHDRPVAAIAVFTTSGRTARLMSKARPVVPILAFTPVEKTYDYLAMLWGTTPYLIPHADSLEEMIAHVDEAVVEGTRVQPGQEILLIAGFPIQKMVPPNFALLHTIEAR